MDIYEKKRKNLLYYNKVLFLIKNYQKKYNLNSIIDIGGWKGYFISKTDLEKRTILDLRDMNDKDDDITRITADFLKYKFNINYDIVICLQVLEHICNNNVKKFAQKLFDLNAKIVIISVPYKWKKGSCKYHLQDPVDQQKLFSWTLRKPSYEVIITEKNNVKRLIAVYEF